MNALMKIDEPRDAQWRERLSLRQKQIDLLQAAFSMNDPGADAADDGGRA